MWITILRREYFACWMPFNLTGALFFFFFLCLCSPWRPGEQTFFQLCIFNFYLVRCHYSSSLPPMHFHSGQQVAVFARKILLAGLGWTLHKCFLRIFKFQWQFKSHIQTRSENGLKRCKEDPIMQDITRWESLIATSLSAILFLITTSRSCFQFSHVLNIK